MKTATAALAILGFTARVIAQDEDDIWIPGPTECSGRAWPNWNDCDELAESTFASDIEAHPGECMAVSWGGDGNCLLVVCWPAPNIINPGVTAPSRRLWAAYDRIQGECKPVDAGGNTIEQFPLGEAFSVSATNDPEYTGGSRVARRSDGTNLTEAFHEIATEVEVTTGGVHVWQSSLEDMQGYLAAEDLHDSAPVAKRQDLNWEPISFSQSVIQPGARLAVGPILGSGAEYTHEITESLAIGISFSVGFEASFWEFFSASAELEISSEYTVSVAESYSFTSGNCENGQNYLYPLYDRYVGRIDGSEHTVWIPNGNDVIDFAIRTECLGFVA